MRVTNSMLVNNLMSDLNVNLRKMEKIQAQLSSGRKYGHISDDPVALIYGQAARNKLQRLSHYQGAVGSAQDWIRHVETGVMELQGRVADVYNEMINASTDVKGLGSSSDKKNVAMLIEQLRDHYLDTLNATFGDKYMYAGYNTPGDSKTAKITGPFTLDNNWNLYYNGHNLSNFLQISIDGNAINTNDAKGIFGGLKLDISGDLSKPPTLQNRVDTAVNTVNDLISGGAVSISGGYSGPSLSDLNTDIKAKYEETAEYTQQIGILENKISQIDQELNTTPDVFFRTDKDGIPAPYTRDELTAEREALMTQLIAERGKESTAKNEMTELCQQRDSAFAELNKHIYTDEPQYDVYGRLSLTVGGIKLLDFDAAATPHVIDAPSAADMTAMEEKLEIMNALKADLLTFDVGPSVSMPVTVNGVDLAIFQGSDGKTLNIFQVLHESFKVSNTGEPAGEIGSYIRELQDSQNHLLTKVAELGGRARRLDLLEARYEQDNINYTLMKSNAEDADFAEVIMNQSMAASVYQAALASGARIIQPTLMDFLR